MSTRGSSSQAAITSSKCSIPTGCSSASCRSSTSPGGKKSEVGERSTAATTNARPPRLPVHASAAGRKKNKCEPQVRAPHCTLMARFDQVSQLSLAAWMSASTGGSPNRSNRIGWNVALIEVSLVKMDLPSFRTLTGAHNEDIDSSTVRAREHVPPLLGLRDSGAGVPQPLRYSTA